MHPERPERLQVVISALQQPAFAGLEWHEAPLASPETLSLVHSLPHVQRVLESVPKHGRLPLDADTVLSPGSGQAALRAVGAVCAATDAVLSGKARNAFCAVRPPGHHAEPNRAMGFCLFNQVAIAARYALIKHGIERISIVDFDVHHGNGTQAAFEKEARVQYVSTHQFPLYPGTGWKDEIGVGNIVNVPLPAHTGSRAYRLAFRQHVLPALFQHDPQLILLSAGFDAHRLDPLAQMELESEDYAWITEQLLAFDRPVVSVLEGGYHLGALAESASAHVASLMQI